jgi:hypothetical protein
MELPTTLAFDGRRIITLGWKNPEKNKYENGIFPRFSMLKFEGIHQMTVNPNAIIKVTYTPDWQIEKETIVVRVNDAGILGEPSYYPYIIVNRVNDIIESTVFSIDNTR